MVPFPERPRGTDTYIICAIDDPFAALHVRVRESPNPHLGVAGHVRRVPVPVPVPVLGLGLGLEERRVRRHRRHPLARLHDDRGPSHVVEAAELPLGSQVAVGDLQDPTAARRQEDGMRQAEAEVAASFAAAAVEVEAAEVHAVGMVRIARAEVVEEAGIQARGAVE